MFIFFPLNLAALESYISCHLGYREIIHVVSPRILQWICNSTAVSPSDQTFFGANAYCMSNFRCPCLYRLYLVEYWFECWLPCQVSFWDLFSWISQKTLFWSVIQIHTLWGNLGKCMLTGEEVFNLKDLQESGNACIS